ncbi:hypothetical protein ACLOJK_003784 [Asimina triloba]
MAREGGETPHVLLVALAVQSHINPMLCLGKRLASKGLHVTLATTEATRSHMLKANANTPPPDAPYNSLIRLEFFSDGLPHDYERTNPANAADIFYHLEHHGPSNLSALIHSLSARNAANFSCIINNQSVPWVADVAQAHGIPCAMLWIQPCALFAIYYRFCNRLNRFPTAADPYTPVQLPGLPLLRPEDLPSFILPNSEHWGGFGRTISLLFENMHKLKWVLCNSFYELEKDGVESMSSIQPITPVGPLVPQILLGEDEDSGVELWKAEESCIEWLDKHQASSVVYVSFGSVLPLPTEQMEKIAWGIKSSGRPFLWVAKLPEHAAEDRSRGLLPPEFMKETEDRGLVVQWCPQAKVLAHPSVACFLTHCGWNSTLEGVVSGVPMIGYPQWTDQPTNAKLLVGVFEVGVRLKAGEDGMVEQGEVERCIVEVTEGAKAVELKKKALQWKEAARAAVRNGGSSDRNIQLFVDEIVKGGNRVVL